MDQYAVFGNPIAQSKSPQIHQAFAASTGQAMEYCSQLVEPDDFNRAADEFFKNGGKGLNVTAPFKGDAYRYATRLSARARRAAAVNTLALQDDGSILGDTSDGVGLVTDMVDNLSWQIERQRILILGAGGATRGVLEALLELKPHSICIANRTASKAVSLAKGFADLGTLKAMGLDELSALTEGFDLIISATSAGLAGQVVELPEVIVNEHCCAYDMIYRAGPTPFMQWAASLGAKTSDGLGMLVGQAAESFNIWRNIAPETSAIIADLRRSL